MPLHSRDAPKYAMKKHILVEFLDCRRLPLAGQEEVLGLHRALCEASPRFYLYLMTDPATDLSHKREMLVRLLERSADPEIERRQLLDVLRLMPINEAFAIINIIRDQRINRSRARELVLSFLIGHEQFPALAAVKRQRLGHLLKHVLGERTWSAIKRALARSTPESEQFLQQTVLRYAWNGDQARAREVLSFLTGVPFIPVHVDLQRRVAARTDLEQGKGLPGETLLGLRGVYHQKTSLRVVRTLSAPSPTTVRQDGPVTALYKEAYTGQSQQAAPVQEKSGPFEKVRDTLVALLKLQVEETIEMPAPLDASSILKEATAALPAIDGSIAVVLDLSASMASSGERLNHAASLALALTRLLQTSVRNVSLYQVGGSLPLTSESLPSPQGSSDLAAALLKAVRGEPRTILIMTDGYENVRQGDVEQIVRGLRQLGMLMPIYQVAPQYTAAENMAQRRLGEGIPLLPLAHENGIKELLARILLATGDENVSDEELGQLQQLLTVR